MATGGGANLAMGGGDPRIALYGDDELGHLGAEGITAYTRPQLRAMRDPNVSFEEYQYYADKCRAEEDASAAEEPKIGIWGALFPSKSNQGIGLDQPRRNSTTIGMVSSDDEKNEKRETEPVNPGEQLSQGPARHGNLIDVNSEEWINAQRATRTASGAAAFYLITTDILGPFSLPYAFGSVGWAPGVVLFTIFAIFAGYSGWLLNRMFRGTDSYQYPTRSYGDVAYKIYGNIARIPVNLLQGIQLLFTVAIITISNGQALSVIAQFKLCYVVCIVILVAVGFILGQIRTLQKFGWLANVAVFMNVFIVIFTMVLAATAHPFYKGIGLSAGYATDPDTVVPNKNGVHPPILHYTNVPPSPLGFVGVVNGVMNTIYAYGGANVFNEFMAEMRRPRDFLRAMWAAQFFIWFVYMFYGLFIYGYQGQYSINPSPDTISQYWAQVVANLFYIFSATIAAVLYGNIGLKVIYNNIFVELLRFPPLNARVGKLIWIGFVPIYWIIAFVVGASIPNFGALVGLVAAICITQFTYTLPPLFYIGYMIQKGAKLEGEGYDPKTGEVTRHDKGWQRWKRGLVAGTMWDQVMMAWNFIYVPAALAMAGLGAYAAIQLLRFTFAETHANAFSCKSPLDFNG